MLTAGLLLVASLDCPTPARRLAVSVQPVSGESLGGQADAAVPGQYRVGSFTYQGHGIAETSTDPAFRELILDQRLGLRHRCGNSVSGPSGWNAKDPDLSRWSFEIEPRLASSEPSPGSVAAEKRGAQPVLEGYLAGATWPAYSGSGQFFLGLMHRGNGSTETLIVAFRDAPQSTPPIIMARLKIAFDTLSIVPDMHGSDNSINLSGWRDGKLTHVVLTLDRQTLSATHAKLMATRPGQ